MLNFELSGITGIWVTNLDEDKRQFFALIVEVRFAFLEGGNDGTQVLKGRNAAKTFLKTTALYY